MGRIIFVRHGETDYNATGRMQGQLDIPLNKRGRQQARVLAQALKREGIIFDQVYSSDLQRAKETADIIMRSTGLELDRLVLEPSFRERFMGEIQGMFRDKAEEKARKEKRKLTDYGERREVFTKRLLIAFERISKHQGNTLVVAHGAALHRLFEELVIILCQIHASRDIRNRLNKKLPNCSVTVIDIDKQEFLEYGREFVSAEIGDDV